MKTTSKLIFFIFTFLALAASAYAESPREQLKQMVEQLQQTPNDNALREKIIKLATSIKPAQAIPEEAREPFVMGATVLKKASDPAGASKAVDLFTQALNVAPWFADAYYNRAMARQAAGQFESAIDDLKLYLGFKLTDNERREAQDKIYSLKADAQLARQQRQTEAAQASPVLAAPVTLSCRYGDGSDTVTLRIDYATGLVEQLSPEGKPYTNRIAPNARVSDNAIVWSVEALDTGLQTPVPMIWGGTIDRLSGTGWEEFSREPGWNVTRTSLTCRQATQKF